MGSLPETADKLGHLKETLTLPELKEFKEDNAQLNTWPSSAPLDMNIP